MQNQPARIAHIFGIVITMFAGCGPSSTPPAKSSSDAPAIIMPSSAAWTSEVHQEPAKVLPDEASQHTDKIRLLASLSGPSNGFADAAIVDDGHRLVMPIRRTNDVTIRDIDSGSEVGHITASPGMVFELAVSRDQSLVALGMNNKTVELWDLPTRARKAILEGHTENVIERVAFNRDGTLLASAGFDKLLKIWDVKEGKELFTLRGHRFGLGAIAFNHDGTSLASISRDGTVVIWDPNSGMERRRFDFDRESPYCLEFVGATDLITIGDSEGVLSYWDSESGEEIAAVQAHTGILFSIAMTDDGKLLATCGQDRFIKLWDAIDLDELASLKAHDEAIVAVKLSRDGKRLVSRGGGDKNEVKLWDVPVGVLFAKEKAKVAPADSQ